MNAGHFFSLDTSGGWQVKLFSKTASTEDVTKLFLLHKGVPEVDWLIQGKSSEAPIIASRAEADVFFLGLLGSRGNREWTRLNVSALGHFKAGFAVVLLAATLDEPVLKSRRHVLFETMNFDRFRFCCLLPGWSV